MSQFLELNANNAFFGVGVVGSRGELGHKKRTNTFVNASSGILLCMNEVSNIPMVD
jgi:hypothetical protein